MNISCPCGKQKSLASCCGRFHSGKSDAKTPEQLMRSRYSAYALGGLGEYLLRTWHPAMINDLTVGDLSAKTCDWISLEVLTCQQQGDKGRVEFKAFYFDENNEEKFLHENSYFQRIIGKWLYVGAVK